MAVTAVATASRLLLAMRRAPVDATPVWFMRQAGRFLPEYRAIRSRLSLLEICARPEVAAEVTLQPVARLGVDAAILFADILLPLVPMGLPLRFATGEGPVIDRPVRTRSDVLALRTDVIGDLEPVLQTVQHVRRALPPEVALIGFAGGPFTVASYAIEGGASRSFLETKKFMYGDPALWNTLLAAITDVTIAYLGAQAAAGAQVVQLFDSWAGALSPDDYRRFVLPHTQRIFRALETFGVPSIHFGVGTAMLLDLQREAGGDAIGIDWRVPIEEAFRRFGEGAAVQGNLDPVALFAPREELDRQVRGIIDAARGRPGHIFNLGHGILPETDPDRVRDVVTMVHDANG
jgi:uroporphyrinogen decarboxylase